MGIIYILENKIDGKCYVGQTIQSFKKRFGAHKNSDTYIGRALKKHGVNNFNKIIIENIPEERMDEIESNYIKKYNSLAPNGYNLETGGNLNKHPSEETIKKNSEVHKGQIPWNKGKKLEPLKEEHREKISKGNSGKIRTKRQKENYSKSKKGTHQTEETKKKLSKLRKGLIPWNKGKKLNSLTKEHREKISKGNSGKVRTKEQKENYSKAQKIRWQIY